MKSRCLNKNSEKYKNYGGRGITVCEEWENDFKTFYDWAMANGYSDELTIERRDVNGNYCPENCCWITSAEQAKNKTSNVVLEFNGESHNLSEWSKITGISSGELSYRIRRGWDVEKALTKRTR